MQEEVYKYARREALKHVSLLHQELLHQNLLNATVRHLDDGDALLGLANLNAADVEASSFGGIF